jgi:hypothetical protein
VREEGREEQNVRGREDERKRKTYMHEKKCKAERDEEQGRG